jgi:hypothetical protein
VNIAIFLLPALIAVKDAGRNYIGLTTSLFADADGRVLTMRFRAQSSTLRTPMESAPNSSAQNAKRIWGMSSKAKI